MSKKNFQGTGVEDINKVLGNIQPDDLTGVFLKTGVTLREITTTGVHTLSGKENLISVNKSCTIILPKAVLFTGELIIKLIVNGIIVTVKGDSSNETIDDNVLIVLNNMGTVGFGSTTMKWLITKY